ncbi:winged helix-turn-helix transcriptional regulator [Rhizobium deserti]|uniref:Winged helix-turn-helix transcriptional regulator n=1 Tax=Rhizobium deserti TaxID=2547961 RepID=A0A4R5UNY9_9HYPH|nr:carbohydrate kinase [Rhizobium deserti]TDK39635.1 winged helix-turn-helix transcriptional regulator [Rhizobium deserti]
MEDPSPQELAVLEAIRENPFVGQQEIATMLGLARSTVAAHIVQLMQKGQLLGRAYVLAEQARALCIGGAVLDRKYRAREALINATSNPVDGVRSLGGVARNVAENLSRLGTATSFVSIVGDDENGRTLLAYMRERGIDVSQTMVTGDRPTAEYAAILDPAGDLVLGLADMGIFDLLQPDHLDRIWPHLASANWVFADCNPPAETLASLIARRQGAHFRLAVDAVSTVKAARLPKDLTGIDLLFMNIDEANSILKRHGRASIEDAREAAMGLQRVGADQAIVTMGAEGIAVAGPEGAKIFSAVEAVSVDMTGAGDAMIAGTLHRVMAGDDIYTAARTGALLGALTTESSASVHTHLSQAFLEANMHRLTG